LKLGLLIILKERYWY